MPDTYEQPNNEVLAVKLDYISKDISTIKADIKEMKNDAIGRREYNDNKKEYDLQFISIHTDIELLKEFRWKLAGIIALATFLSSGIGMFLLKFIIQ